MLVVLMVFSLCVSVGDLRHRGRVCGVVSICRNDVFFNMNIVIL